MTEEPRFVFGLWVARPEPVIEFVTVTATCAPEAPLTFSLSQGYVTFDTHLAAASYVVGSLPLGQSMFLPHLASGPLTTTLIGLPTDETLAMQAQYLMALA